MYFGKVQKSLRRANKWRVMRVMRKEIKMKLEKLGSGKAD